MEEKLRIGVAATTPCLLQRDGGSFTGPIWTRPGSVAWYALADASGLLLPLAVEDVPSHMAAVLPPLVFGYFFSVRPESQHCSW